MLVFVGIFILTFVGGVFSGQKPPPPYDSACRDDPENPNNSKHQAYSALAKAEAFAAVNQEKAVSNRGGKSFSYSSAKASSLSKSSASSYASVISSDGGGDVFSGHKLPPPCDSAYRDDPKNLNNPKHQVYTDHAKAEAFAAATQEKALSDGGGKSLSYSSAKASSLSKSSPSSYTIIISRGASRDDPKNPKNPKHQVYADHAKAEAFAAATQEKVVSDGGGTSLSHSSAKASSLSKSSASSHTSVISSDGGGGDFSGHKPPPPCDSACRDDPKNSNNPKRQVYAAHAKAEAFAAVTQEKTVSDCDGKSSSHPGVKASSVSKSSASSYTSAIASDCGGQKCRDPNAVYKSCPNPCPVSCDNPFPKGVCNRACVEFGCECAPGFILDVNDMLGKCVRPENCPEPIPCPKHSHYVMNDNQCPKTCGNRLLPTSDVAGACDPFTGCLCNPGFVRKYDNATGPCIPEKECPPIPKYCGINETPTSCRIICPPQTCQSILAKYYCIPTECEPGCNCLNGYLRNKDGVCIPSEDCFKPDPIKCGPYEVASDCAIVCPPQSCESLYTTYMCAKTNCTAGCNCIDSYLRNSRGVCVPSDECYNDPAGCDGDVNATRVRGCSDACPPTCEKPDPKLCSTICILNGCDCKPGYIRSCDDGNCIEPQDCPGGSPNCGANQTYVDCKIGCPTNYCPVDDSRAQVACSMPYPCRGGCACKKGHLIVSREDPRCVLASDCPKVKCTRPNEVWDRNPSNCFLERCEDRGSVCDYPYSFPGPRCVCKKGFYRNENDICISASECPPLGCKGDLNATLKQCPSPCPKTCDDPNAGSEGCIDICLPDDCECNPGFVLTKKEGGVCIKLEDCPGCGGDPNAVYKSCPSACEPTCTNPNPRVCTKQCMPSGCVCKPGFVKNEKNGKCIKPENCPEVGCKGDCNATYTECTSMCPLTCAEPDPRPCVLMCGPSGCECNPGYVRNEDGKCIKPEDCPAPLGCKGDLNATLKQCPSPCPKTCDDPNAGSEGCIEICLPDDCECNPGFVLTKKEGGVCIKLEDCPEVGCKGDCNATYTECTSMCPLTCAEPDPRPCIAMCGPSGCACNPGYVRNEDGKCIKPEDCPVVEKGCNGDLNATHSDCPTACPATCANQYSKEKILCPAVCDPSGCVCKQGYILTKKGGICVKPEDCPELGCKGDPNAEYSDCPSACQATCEKPDSNQPCTRQCLPRGCVCKPGYIRIKKGGKCIKPKSCPEPGCGGDPNAVYKECPSACEPSCANPKPEICTMQCMPSGCVCKPGFVQSKKGGKCIKPENCPDLCNGDRNATFTEGPRYCQATCKHPDTDGLCNDSSMPPGCVCKQGYLLKKKGGQCIKPEDCPGGWPTCRANETYVYCKVGCPTNYCPVDDSLDEIACDPLYPCPGGCACKVNYLLVSKEDDRCILSSECPEVECTRPNEVWDRHAPGCLHERCDDRDIPCDFQYPGPPRCRCIKGYYRNNDGICVPERQCPQKGCNGDMNATFSKCPSKCPATCCDPDPICTKDCAKPGCVCNEGFIQLKPGGPCIRPYDCPARKGCKGDMNATFSECPSKCPATCCDPDQICTKDCADPGCECNEGFIQSVLGGLCIRPYDCEGGSPLCSENMTYVNCKIDCPMKYCPENENEIFVICDPIWPCPPGCECKPGYLMLNTAEKTCVLAADCPSRECTRLNEVWDPSPSICNYERCDQMYYTCDDPNPGRPKCVCKKGYYKNDYGVCIPAEECHPSTPVCGINEIARDCRRICPPQTCLSKYALFNCIEDLPCEPGCDCVPNYLRDDRGICIPSEQCPAPCQIPDECKRTCAEPNPPNCVYNPPTVNMDGCDCKDGYILSKLGGECIPIDQCPPDIACGGDPNARPKRCPKACPSTCKSPNQFPCKRMCEPIACECKSGYIRSNDSGRCILPDKCPGGNPCGKKAHFVDCKTNCPGDYCPVDDNRDLVFCDPPAGECLSGCICNLNHKRKSRDDPRCIVSSDCPPVNCTRPNEEWCSCPSACLAENCEDVHKQPSVCNTLVLNCDPRCICKKGHFRDSSGICIPAEDCPPKGCKGDMNATFSDCPSKCPATCCDPDSERMCTTDCAEPGCVCNEGFILFKPGGPCIRPCDCPPQKGCKGDMNATFSDCPSKCPATCCDPDPICTKDCADPGCVCNEGFIQLVLGGPCIRPYDCEGGSPQCCDNMTYVNCKIDCPMKYCPENENEVFVICDPIWPCPSGCACKPGYLMPNKTDKTCILAADCPPRECTRLNEVWDPSPSICNYERCDQMYYTCDDPKPGRPKCVCKKDYYKDDNGVCIPAEECPKPKCGYNEVEVPCRQICPPQNCEIAYTDYACTEESKICEPGCDCLPDHLRNGSGICIPNEECPYPSTPVCGINEIARDCRRICPPQTCLSKYVLFRCVEDLPCEPGCDCVPNYLRDDRGICIPSEQCPAPEPICGYNEVAVPCRQICPPQNCEISYTEYACTNESEICEPGCDCLPDHLRNGSGICIPNEECPYPSTPVCGINEIARDCRRICPPQTCLSKYALFSCIEDLPCEPGCDCVPNYLRDDRGICIPSEQCPAPCQIPDECKRTCAEPNPPNCEYNPPKVNMNGCDCKDGFILSELGGDCIAIDQCPPEIACHGDPNARPKRCPKPCPSTCKSPNQLPCKKMCDPIGCQCKPGLILYNDTGLCILPDECPGGNPCGKKARFVDCKTDGPRDYCPVDDKVLCDPPIADECMSGCICDLNHRRKSQKDPRCIESSDCPRVNCTRPNEKWSSCPSACLAENCEDVNNQPTFCYPLILNCDPRCICKKNHFRNSSGICIPAEDCPIGCNGDPNAVYNNCPSACEPTCTCPNPENCTAEPKPAGCVCKQGFVRNEENGKCIELKDCPGCGGDPNAVYKDCPSACEPTCANPNPQVCTAECKPSGCVCKLGFVLNEKDGKCIDPDSCPESCARNN